jgi:hypothetical protein
MDWALVLATDFECFLSVVRCQDGVPFSRQHQRHQVADHRVVFGKQYHDCFFFARNHDENSWFLDVRRDLKRPKLGLIVSRQFPISSREVGFADK